MAFLKITKASGLMRQQNTFKGLVKYCGSAGETIHISDANIIMAVIPN